MGLRSAVTALIRAAIPFTESELDVSHAPINAMFADRSNHYKMNPLPHPPIAKKLNEVQRPTRQMLHARTRELAARAGRIPPHVNQQDYEDAKRELTGESEMERQDAVFRT